MTSGDYSEKQCSKLWRWQWQEQVATAQRERNTVCIPATERVYQPPTHTHTHTHCRPRTKKLATDKKTTNYTRIAAPNYPHSHWSHINRQTPTDRRTDAAGRWRPVTNPKTSPPSCSAGGLMLFLINARFEFWSLGCHSKAAVRQGYHSL